MIGTLVNVIAIVAGAAIGMLLRKGIPERIRDSLLKAEGLAIVLIGLSSVLGEMFSMNAATGKLQSDGGLLLLVSLVFGCLAGAALRIDDRITAAAQRLEKRFQADGFARGLVAATIVFSVGAMAIIGPINEGLSGDRSILYIKSMLDFTTAIVLASAMGIGVLFSCVAVFVVQIIPALLAAQLAPYITPLLLSLFCMVGYTLVTAIGINFLSETKIRVANLLPSLLIPIGYYFLFEPA
ncbi:MAG: DUF554 domain-containing protein [Planctomycetota bacterium]|nr:DUF554 domain-containing protein [Planctomycetota bacterium]